MFIKKVEVEGFRGFVEKQVFNLGQSKVIILYGPNGHGKTSFFDAVEWGLTGKLYRYDISNDERNRSKFIANQTSGSATPKVKLVLMKDKKEVTIIRTGENSNRSATDYGKSNVEVWNEDGVLLNNPEDYLTKLIVNNEWLEKVSLNNINRMYNLTHNLGQEKITHFINDTKDGDRYNSISVMLGTDYFREYEVKFKNVKERIKNAIEERNKFLKSINDNKIVIIKEIDFLQQQMQIEEVQENDIQKLIKEFSDTFNLNTEIDFTTLPKLVNQIKRDEIEREGKLTEEIGKVKTAQDNIQNLKSKLSDETKLQYKLSKLRDLSHLRQIFKELETLKNTLPQLRQNRDKLSSDRNRKNKLVETIEQLQKKYNINYDLYNKLNEVIKEAYINGNFFKVLEFTKENITISKFNESLSSNLLSLIKLINEEQVLEEKLNLREKLYADSKEHLESITNLNDKYKLLLKTTFEYLESHPDLTSCPVCGSEEIDMINIVEHMNHVQNMEDAGFTFQIEKSHEYREDIVNVSKELKDKQRGIKEYRTELKKLLADFEKGVSLELVEIDTLQNEVKIVSQNIQVEELKLAEIEKTLLKYDFPINLENRELIDKISVELSNISMEILKIEKEFNLEKSYNVESLMENYKIILNELTDDKNYIYQIMSSLGYDGIFDYEKFEFYLGTKIANIEKQSNAISGKKQLLSNLKSNIDSFMLVDKLKEARGKLESYNQQFIEEEDSIKKLNIDLKVITQLIDSVPNTIDKLNNESLQKLFHLVQSIYNKINSHPLYRKIEFNATKRYKSNRLLLNVLTDDGVESNPTFIYSAAQIRTLAISLFLAMAIKQKWTSLNVICMDDPIQSMDDLNIISFIDLMRVLVSQDGLNKQFIISTHNSNFYDMLRKKFRMIDIGLIQYNSYGKNGPVFSNEQGEFSDEDVVFQKVSQYNHNISNELKQFLAQL